MKQSRLVQQSFRSMRRYPLRTILMMLGSVVGVAALTFVLSVGRGAQEIMLRTVRQILGDQAILIQAGGGTMMGGPRGGSARLTLDDMEAVAREVPEIDAWDPQVQTFNAAVKRGGASATARVLGESERWSQVWQRGVSRGQDFDASAVAGMGRVALIGETAARSLFAGDDPIGGEVEIGSVPFRVIGVLDRFGIDLHGMDRDNEIVVPVSTMMRRVKNVDGISGAKLIVKHAGREEEAAEQVRRVLRARHGLSADQPDDFHMMTSTEIHRMESKIERVLLLYVPLVGAVALIVGGIVAAVIMLASVTERVARDRIALRRRREPGRHPAPVSARDDDDDRPRRPRRHRAGNHRRQARDAPHADRCAVLVERRFHRARGSRHHGTDRGRLPRAPRRPTQSGRCTEMTVDRWTGGPVSR